MTQLKIFLCSTQAQILQCKYAEIKDLQRRLLEKQLTTKFFILEQKGHFLQKNGGTIKKTL